MDESIKIEVDELIKKFQEAGIQIANQAAKAVEKCCIMVESDAKQLCPVDTGRLKGSITHRLKKDKNEIVGEIGTNVEYAAAVEFGSSEEWKGTFVGKGGKYKKRKLYSKTFNRKIARPFLYPALKMNELKIKKELAKVMKELLSNGSD
jgi:HK97 gp10 family phage protein